MEAEEAAENYGDEWGLTRFLWWEIYTSFGSKYLIVSV